MADIDEQIHNLQNEIHHLKQILTEKEETLQILTAEKVPISFFYHEN